MPPHPQPLAVVLLSGGIDSATCLAVARAEGFACHALSFDYGQRHRVELAASERVASSLGAASHRTLRVDLRAIGGSALTADIPVPKDRAELESRPNGGEMDIPVTYVPARNMLFLSLAVAHAEVLGAWDIFIGVNAVDYSGYPDCRPEFIRAFEHTANLATRAGITSHEHGPRLAVRTPLATLSKAQIIHLGARLGVDFSLTLSCYDPADGLACGHCDSCLLRRKGFTHAGVPDPTRYAGAPT
ncbi:MAG: 7-cyano-7-deazaguanine synthase QueC [Phycisphaeraceae bacterium]|nr:7-cyano-7-deazaguanine synthase QueC [Phycisphaeraceae bacterium]